MPWEEVRPRPTRVPVTTDRKDVLYKTVNARRTRAEEAVEDSALAGRRPRLRPDPVIEVYKAGVDRTLLRENLKRSVTERFERLMALQRFAEELRRAGREARARR